MNNKKLGDSFESEMCNILSGNGFWAYNTKNKVNGQPMDIIASKNNIALIMDAKVCENDYFLLERVEYNQELAIRKFQDCGNWYTYFAFKFSNDSICVVDADIILMQVNIGKKRLRKTELFDLGYGLEEWLGKW